MSKLQVHQIPLNFSPCHTNLVVYRKVDHLARITFSFHYVISLFEYLQILSPPCLHALFLPKPRWLLQQTWGVTYALLNALGAHYHKIFRFLTALHFLQTKIFLSEFSKSVSRIVYFGFLVSSATFVDTLNYGC